MLTKPALKARIKPLGFNPADSVRKFTGYLSNELRETSRELPGAQMNRAFSADEILLTQNTWGDAPG